jgi:hypothetical protein
LVYFIGQEYNIFLVAEVDKISKIAFGQTLSCRVAWIDEDKCTHLTLHKLEYKSETPFFLEDPCAKSNEILKT